MSIINLSSNITYHSFLIELLYAMAFALSVRPPWFFICYRIFIVVWQYKYRLYSSYLIVNLFIFVFGVKRVRVFLHCMEFFHRY